jgi:signal transduction histidine kinase
MTQLSAEQAPPALLVAANRAALYGTIARRLMHDLRGPAQAISLVTDLMEQGDTLDEPSVRASLQEASGRLRHLLDLLDQVLRRPEIDEEPRPIALRELIAMAVALLKLQRSAVVLDAAPALAARLPAVRGVDDHVLHALLNVLVNADEALALKGGGTVRVTADATGDAVRIAVTDDGPGPTGDVGRLFQPFVTTKSGSRLAGLGLAVARELLQRSGGTVRYEPAGPGTTFVLELPVWAYS